MRLSLFFPITHSHKSLYTIFGYVLIVQCLNHDLIAQVWKTVLTFWIRMGRFTAPHWVSWTLLEGQTRTTNYSCWRMMSRNGKPNPFFFFIYIYMDYCYKNTISSQTHHYFVQHHTANLKVIYSNFIRVS